LLQQLRDFHRIATSAASISAASAAADIGASPARSAMNVR
jgi:hypothetical protein